MKARWRGYARLDFDRRHTFVQSYVYELPFGKNKKYLTSGAGQWIAGGWQLNGVLSLMTGRPFTIKYRSRLLDRAMDGLLM